MVHGQTNINFNKKDVSQFTLTHNIFQCLKTRATWHVMQCRWQLFTDVSEAIFPSEMSLKADKQDLNLHQYHSEASNFSSLVSVNDVAGNEIDSSRNKSVRTSE